MKVPTEIVTQLGLLHRLRLAGKKDEVAELSDLIGNRLYRWVGDALREHSTESVVAILAEGLPVVSKESGMSFKERLDLVYQRSEDLLVSVSIWRRKENEVLAMRIDQRSADPHRSEPEQYLMSRPPVLYAKHGEQVIVGDVETLQRGRYRFGENFWNVFTFLDFIEPTRISEWPDVLLSRGPEGQGRYVTPLQVHLWRAKEWRIIFGSDDEYAYGGGSLEFNKPKGILTACWADHGDGGCQELNIRHGHALLPYKLVYSAIGAVPEPEAPSPRLSAELQADQEHPVDAPQ